MRTASVLIWFSILCFLTGNEGFGQFNPEPREISDVFFPEPVDFRIQTPAFQKKEGFTSYDEMMAWLGPKLKDGREIASLTFIGESQKGKKIPMIVLTKNNGKPKIRFWLQGGLHGDEPAGTEAMLHLIDRFISHQDLTFLLEHLEIAVVPMANIDGYEKQQREAADGTDLNRDQTRFKAKESIALKKAFNAFHPQVALDFHEYRAYRKNFARFGRAGIASRYDAMFLYSGNLNVPDTLRKFTKSRFVDPSKRVLGLDPNQFCHRDYITPQKYGGQVHFNQGSVHARSSASSWALANTVSALLEIRGVGLGRTSFKRRVYSSWVIALSWLENAYSMRVGLPVVLTKSASARNPVVVLSERKIQKDTILALDLETRKEIKLGVTIHNALESKPVLQRSRPFAYLLDSNEIRAARNLQHLGLKLDTLRSEQLLEVETYLSEIASEEAEENNPEGDDEEADKSSTALGTRKIQRKFPKGSFVVYLDQERANLACEVLEPENPNGFVAMKVIKTGKKENPVYRYLKTEKITP
jgi:hypothetical protein